ncbi:MAG TPA: hypothetical protein VHG33_03285 [Woeseiaceae bacterium]|nr:hypothetical protein [Woeseiaceae bacterium]
MSLTRNALLICALALCPRAFAGGILELEMTEHYEDPPVVSTVEISTSGSACRMEVDTPGQRESGGMIYRGDSGDMIALDHSGKRYYVLDEASMQEMGSQLSGAMKQMQEALDSMPPDQRAMAEKMMKQHMPAGMQQPARAPSSLHETGREDTVSGFACDYYEVRRNGTKVRELCVTSWDELPGGRDIAETMLEMAGFYERMTEALSEEAGIGVLGEQQELFAHLEELDGYPVLTREFDPGGEVASESVLKSATVADLEPSLFEPPAGYTRMSTGL